MPSSRLSPKLSSTQRNIAIAGGIVLLHAGALYALQTGLLRRAVEVIVPVELLAQPGKHPVTLTVQAGDEADLLTATLEVGPAVVTGVDAKPGGFGLAPALGWGAAALLLAGLGWLLLRRRGQ